MALRLCSSGTPLVRRWGTPSPVPLVPGTGASGLEPLRPHTQKSRNAHTQNLRGSRSQQPRGPAPHLSMTLSAKGPLDPRPVSPTAWQGRPGGHKSSELPALPRDRDGDAAGAGGVGEGAPGPNGISANARSANANGDGRPGVYRGQNSSNSNSSIDIAKISVWDSKPAWCQPWTILLTGSVAISGSWGVFHAKWFTTIVCLLIGAWWLTFLVFYPQAYKQAVLESLAEQRGQDL